MNRLKKLIALATLAVTLSSSVGVLEAGQYGQAYEGSQKAPSISPTVALGTVAVIAVIAVIVHNNRSNKHGHSSGGGSGGSGTSGHAHSHAHG